MTDIVSGCHALLAGHPPTPEASSFLQSPGREPATMDATLTPTPLSDQVRGVLSQSHFLAPRQVQIETNEGNVRLEGTVSSFYHKQMAQELVRRLDGVEQVENQLQVNWA